MSKLNEIIKYKIGSAFKYSLLLNGRAGPCCFSSNWGLIDEEEISL